MRSSITIVLSFVTNSHVANPTPGGSILQAARKILGLGSKFIPIPVKATTKKNATESYDNLERNFGWKVIFAGDDYSFKKSKTYLKSTNCPDLPPPQSRLRMCKYEVQLWRLFSHHPRLKSNLSKIQKRLLQMLQHDGVQYLQLQTIIWVLWLSYSSNISRIVQHT